MDGTALITPCSALLAWLQATLNIYTTITRAHTHTNQWARECTLTLSSLWEGVRVTPPHPPPPPHVWKVENSSPPPPSSSPLPPPPHTAPSCRYLKAGVSSAYTVPLAFSCEDRRLAAEAVPIASLVACFKAPCTCTRGCWHFMCLSSRF